MQDKDSTFIAYAALAESVQDIKRTREYVVEQANGEYRPDEPASHVAHGARFLSLIQGKSGLNESHFEVALHLENDGEDRAGRTIVDALAGANACDVVVCVSRWFGGDLLCLMCRVKRSISLNCLSYSSHAYRVVSWATAF